MIKFNLGQRYKKLGDRILHICYVFNYIEKHNVEVELHCPKINATLLLVLNIIEPPTRGTYTLIDNSSEGEDIAFVANEVSRKGQYRNLVNIKSSIEIPATDYVTWQVDDGTSISSKKKCNNPEYVRHLRKWYNNHFTVISVEDHKKTNPDRIYDRIFLIKHSLFHIGIDSGMMHIAFCLGKKVFLHRFNDDDSKMPNNYTNIYKHNNVVYHEKLFIPNNTALYKYEPYDKS